MKKSKKEIKEAPILDETAEVEDENQADALETELIEENALEGDNNGQDEEIDDDILNFDQMGLDDRLLLAVMNLGWLEPTPIQETAIPLILEGRDVLAKARTGSGKTGAYAIPLIQKILK